MLMEHLVQGRRLHETAASTGPGRANCRRGVRSCSTSSRLPRELIYEIEPSQADDLCSPSRYVELVA